MKHYDREDLDNAVWEMGLVIKLVFWLTILGFTVNGAVQGYVASGGSGGAIIGGLIGLVVGLVAAWIGTRFLWLITHAAAAVGKVEEHLTEIRAGSQRSVPHQGSDKKAA